MIIAALITLYLVMLFAYFAVRNEFDKLKRVLIHADLMRAKLEDKIALMQIDYDRFNVLGVRVRQLENAPAWNNDYNLNRFNEIFTRLVKLEYVPVAESKPHVVIPNLGNMRITLADFMQAAADAIAREPMTANAIILFPDYEYTTSSSVTSVDFSKSYVRLNQCNDDEDPQ